MDVFELYAKLGLDTSEYESGLDSAKGKAGSVGGAIGGAAKIGLAAVTAATGATVAFAGSAVNAGMSFDSSMSQVAATMGTTVDQIGELRDFAQEMGSTTAFSATQSADALNYMALAGYDANQSMQMLPNVLNLAASGGMELARASDMITDTQSALGLSSAETTELVDKMAKTASKSNTSVEQLGDAMLTVGGTAKMMHGGTTELSAALGILADNGTKGAEGGTKLRNILLSLGAPTDKAAETMDALGVSAYDADGNMRPLQDTFADLNNAMSTMTEADKTNIINTIFNKADLKDVNALLATSGQRWDELSAEINNAQGAAQDMADTQLDNLAGDITLFQSALEGAQIAISDALTPSIREFVQFGTDGLSKLTMAFQEGGLSGAMEAFGEILSDGLNMIIEKLPEFVDGGMKLLGALGQGLMDNIDTILFAAGDIAEILLNGLLEATQGGGGKIAEIIDWILGVFSENYEGLIDTGMQILANIVKGIGEALPQIIPQMVYVATEIAHHILDNLPLLLDAGMQLLQGLAQGILEALPILVDEIPELILQLTDAFTNNIDGIIQTGVQIIVALIQGLSQALPQLIAKMPEIIMALFNALIVAIPQLLTAGVQIIGELIKGIASMVPTLVAEAPKMIMAFIQGILDLREKLRQTGDEIIDHIKNAISEKIKDAVNWGKDLVSNFISGLKSKWGDLKSSASNLGSIIKSHLGFSEPEEGPLSNFHTYAPDMIDLFVQGIKDNAGKLTRAVDSMAGDVYDAMPTFATAGGYDTMSAGGYAGSDESGDLVTAITDALMNMQLSVNIGNRPIEAMITDAQQKTNYRSGGR